MVKKEEKMKVDLEKIKKSWSYRFSKWTLNHKTSILFILSIMFSVLLGISNNMSSENYKKIGSVSNDKIMIGLLVVNILYVTMELFTSVTAKATKLNVGNDMYLKIYRHAFHSKITDIISIGPEKILDATSQLAVLSAEIKEGTGYIIRVAIPFSLVAYKTAQLNILATLIMVIIMIACIVLSLNGDKLFHFDTIKSELKGDMQSIYTNNFITIKTLKYMDAEEFALKRLEDGQNMAAPAMQNSARILYNTLINALSQVPNMIALAIAFSSRNTELAAYVAFSEWTILSMISNATGLAETLSEKHGQESVLTNLKGDDIPYADRPIVPEIMEFKKVNLYYPSDEKKENPFYIENLEIIRGKRYRFYGKKGAGKSTVLKFLAGEIPNNYKPNVKVYYVHQFTDIIRDTMYNNITFGDDSISRAEIISVLEEVDMGGWLRTHERGLDTILCKDVELSGGERQCLTIARLILHLRRCNDDLVVLDEITSALDIDDEDLEEGEISTKEKVIRLIDRECKSTLIVISHENKNEYGFKDIVDYTVKVTPDHIIHEAVPTGRIVETPITVSCNVPHQKRMQISK